MAQSGRTRVLGAVISAIIVLVVLLSLVYVLTRFLNIPFEIYAFSDAALVAAVIFVILRIITSFIRNYFSKYTTISKVHPVIFLINLFGYFVMGVAVLGVLGVDVSSLILGGSLLTVVIGLATQTVLANQFAGILLTTARPFRIGDLVTINTWQYGGAYPVLFPKYFSVDRIEATAYTGTVTDITINYTVLKMQSGDEVRLPNGVIVQAAVIVRSPGILVKARYEIPKFIFLDSIREKIEKTVEAIEGYDGGFTIGVDETTLNTYILMVTAKFTGMDADFYRGKILEGMLKIVEPLKTVN